jgi:glycerol uptake facilitator-like aquaporin
MSSPKTILSLYSQNKDILRSLLAEFCATGLLVLFTCGTCVLNSGNTLSIALSFGLTITCLIAIFGHVSGCHINPGVTIGLLANGQLATVRAVLYIVAQLLGSVLGATILAAVLPTGRKNLCATTLNPMISPVQGIIVELFIVFLLVFVICNVCESNSNLAPLTIGLAVATGHLFAVFFIIIIEVIFFCPILFSQHLYL